MAGRKVQQLFSNSRGKVPIFTQKYRRMENRWNEEFWQFRRRKAALIRLIRNNRTMSRLAKKKMQRIGMWKCREESW